MKTALGITTLMKNGFTPAKPQKRIIGRHKTLNNLKRVVNGKKVKL